MPKHVYLVKHLSDFGTPDGFIVINGVPKAYTATSFGSLADAVDFHCQLPQKYRLPGTQAITELTVG